MAWSGRRIAAAWGRAGAAGSGRPASYLAPTNCTSEDETHRCQGCQYADGKWLRVLAADLRSILYNFFYPDNPDNPASSQSGYAK